MAGLCLAGLAAEAALAGRAATRRDEKAHDQATRIAVGLLERARAAAGADGVTIDGAVRAKLLTVEAERTRVAGHGDPDRWAEAAGAWDELGLTPREREVLALVAEGRTDRQIAQALFITDKTASVHVSNILAKLGVAHRAEAAATVHRLGLTG